MSSPPGSFEFRIWGNHLSAFQEQLAAMARPSGLRESAKTYILSGATDAANVKIRDGLLDIKVVTEQLVGSSDGVPYSKPDSHSTHA